MPHMEKDPSKGLNAALAATLNGERVASGMTFDQLADATGISKRTLLRQLSKMERHIDIADAATIAQTFDMSLVEVLALAEERMNRPRKGEEDSRTA